MTWPQGIEYRCIPAVSLVPRSEAWSSTALIRCANSLLLMESGSTVKNGWLSRNNRSAPRAGPLLLLGFRDVVKNAYIACNSGPLRWNWSTIPRLDSPGRLHGSFFLVSRARSEIPAYCES